MDKQKDKWTDATEHIIFPFCGANRIDTHILDGNLDIISRRITPQTSCYFLMFYWYRWLHNDG